MLEGDGVSDPASDDATEADPPPEEIDAPPPVTWAEAIGDGDYDWAYGAGRTPDGGFVLAGETWATGDEHLDIMAIRLDAQGEVRWQKIFTSEADERHRGLAMARDGGFVITGARDASEETGHDILAVKIDADGEIVWQVVYGSPGYDWGHTIEATSDGGFIIGGETLPSGGTHTMVVLKIDGQGNIAWQKVFPRETYGWSIAIHEAPDGGYFIGGETYNMDGNGSSAWVLRLDEAGMIVWQKVYGGESWVEVWSIAGTPDGGVVLAGATQAFGAGLNDFWIFRLDADGEVRWQKACGGIYNDHAKGVEVTADGGFVVTGETWSAGAGNEDILLLKLDADGNAVWQRTYGGPDSDWGWAVFQAADGGFFLHGTTDTYGAGEIDIWALKTDAGGRLGPDCPAGVGVDADLAVSSAPLEPLDTHTEASDAGLERREIGLVGRDMDLAVQAQCGP
jgi:hypothetical protein